MLDLPNLGVSVFLRQMYLYFFIVDRKISVFCTNLWSIHYIYTKKATKVGANHSVFDAGICEK